MDTCTIPDCGKPLRSKGADYCPMHYHRWYRHGDPLKVATRSGVTASLGRRYRTMTAAGHPLAGASGKVYVHRHALYQELGGADAPCHYCGTALRWAGIKGEPDAMQVDHLDDDGGNNHPANLVPCCPACNTTKALTRRHLALKGAGWWSVNDTVDGLRSPAMRRKGFDLSLAASR